jgi:signal transduction histidine kinase/CheY-like chemotaxis protein
MFKWGLFKKDSVDIDLPDEIQKEMKSIYSKYSGSDPVVLVMDQLSEMIREQRNEIDSNAQKVEKLEMKLKRAYSEKNFQADLLTSMCDEIQAPIHAMNQLGDWLNQTHLDLNQKAGFDLYRVTGRKLNDLFKNIIDVARLREGILQLDPISFQMQDLVRDIKQSLNLTAQEKGISLTVDIDPDVPQHLVGDMKRLEQVLFSLINNAIKFTYEGEVLVSINKGRDDNTECAVNFLVMDSGMGIPESHLDNIFNRLSQGDPDVERNFGGTGLGLYICKSLVEQMGGAIWAENRKEGGATFGFAIQFEKGSLEQTEEGLLFFPPETVNEESGAEDSEPVVGFAEEDAPEETDVAGDNGESKNLKVLVVDDCEETCRLIESFLSNGPYDLEVVHDGLVALERHAAGSYDLILMDIQLPGLDGVGATMEIRGKETEGVQRTAIFALVGSTSEKEGYYHAADFDQCLSKPISKEQLLESIATLEVPHK